MALSFSLQRLHLAATVRKPPDTRSSIRPQLCCRVTVAAPCSPLCRSQELEQQAIAAEARLMAFDRRNHLGVSVAVASKLKKAIVQVGRERGAGWQGGRRPLQGREA